MKRLISLLVVLVIVMALFVPFASANATITQLKVDSYSNGYVVVSYTGTYSYVTYANGGFIGTTDTINLGYALPITKIDIGFSRNNSSLANTFMYGAVNGVSKTFTVSTPIPIIAQATYSSTAFEISSYNIGISYGTTGGTSSSQTVSYIVRFTTT
ncbi:MAG: hypothetical protein LBN00_02485, partial [Oscillospiraceae bacterium]|nr:hypothetical protein [Oscillospiraceae bacterium]